MSTLKTSAQDLKGYKVSAGTGVSSEVQGLLSSSGVGRTNFLVVIELTAVIELP